MGKNGSLILIALLASTIFITSTSAPDGEGRATPVATTIFLEVTTEGLATTLTPPLTITYTPTPAPTDTPIHTLARIPIPPAQTPTPTSVPVLIDTPTPILLSGEGTDHSDANDSEPQQLSIDAEAEAQMFGLVNEERRKAGKAELRRDPLMDLVARAHARDMYERLYFMHTNPDGKSLGERLAEGGVPFALAGENLARAPTVPLAFQGFIASEGHRKNILDPRFGRVGIGVINGGNQGKVFTLTFAD